MGIITTYVCDVSGKQGPAEEFVKINIYSAKVSSKATFVTGNGIEKVIHIDVARKLNLVLPAKNEEVHPEPTFESKLGILITERIEAIAYEVAENNRN